MIAEPNSQFAYGEIYANSHTYVKITLFQLISSKENTNDKIHPRA